MTPNAFATQLRQLAAAEQARRKDFSDRARTVIDQRVQAIMDGPGTDEQKAVAEARTRQQALVFFQRDPYGEIPF